MITFTLIPIQTLVSVVLVKFKANMCQATLNCFDQDTDNQGGDFSLERFYDLRHWSSDPSPNQNIWARVFLLLQVLVLRFNSF